MKIPFKPGTLIYPLPAVMVTCGDCEENYNIITIGWTGTICSDPPMCYISVRKERHSHELIMKNKEFVINLTTEDAHRACPNRESPFDCRVAVEHRVQGGGSEGIRFARYVHR